MFSSSTATSPHVPARVRRQRAAPFIMLALLLVLGVFLIYPVLLILIQSFNVSDDIFIGAPQWGLDNWRQAFRTPGLLQSLGNTLLIWASVMTISLPTAILISWTLARTRIPLSHGLEFMFWVAFMMPNISVTMAWVGLLDPDVGTLNVLLEKLPFIEEGPFNIFSVPGIVWAHLMANGIATKVMLLTPAFRNMDVSLEEAASVSGANKLRTLLRVTLPVMVSPILLVFALQLIRIFQSFEIEQLLGTPFGFFVYSTFIYDLVGFDPPDYGKATVLSSISLFAVALILPFQRWILHRRNYATVTGSFKPGLIDLGPWNYAAFALIAVAVGLLTVVPAGILLFNSFMTSAGFFGLSPVFTLEHWQFVLDSGLVGKAVRTTLLLALTTALVSPLLFSMIAYILVRTQWRGRFLLDMVIWGSGAIPGILAGLGLLMMFLGTPVLSALFGTIWPMMIVVVLQGNTVGTNIMKGTFVQIGKEMEEAARVSGAGWARTYFHIWIPLLTPTLVMVGTLNFIFAAGTVGPIVLLSGIDTLTLSIVALSYGSSDVALFEEASIVSLIIIGLTVGVALIMRRVCGRRLALY